MDRQMDGQMNGWKDRGVMNGWTDGGSYEWMEGMNGWTDRWGDRWVDRQVGGLMDRWMV